MNDAKKWEMTESERMTIISAKEVSLLFHPAFVSLFVCLSVSNFTLKLPIVSL